MASPYLKAALLTAAIVSLGFFFISQLDAMRANEIRSEVEGLLFQSEAERMLFTYSQLMSNDTDEICIYLDSSAQTKASQAYALSEKIRYYEQSNLADANYDKIRNQYYLSNMGLYLNIRAAETYCGTTPYDTVLFFYKIKEDCPECRAQGGVLDNLRRTRPNLRVFAFPYDTNLQFIDVFVKRHGISQVPALVINNKDVLLGLTDENGVATHLSKN